MMDISKAENAATPTTLGLVRISFFLADFFLAARANSHLAGSMNRSTESRAAAASRSTAP